MRWRMPFAVSQWRDRCDAPGSESRRSTRWAWRAFSKHESAVRRGTTNRLAPDVVVRLPVATGFVLSPQEPDYSCSKNTKWPKLGAPKFMPRWLRIRTTSDAGHITAPRTADGKVPPRRMRLAIARCPGRDVSANPVTSTRTGPARRFGDKRGNAGNQSVLAVHVKNTAISSTKGAHSGTPSAPVRDRSGDFLCKNHPNRCDRPTINLESPDSKLWTSITFPLQAR